jgi:hypothetical protein
MVTVKEKTTVTQLIHGNCPNHSRTEISVRDVNMNRLVEGAGIVGTTEEYVMAAQRLVEHGYLRGDAERKKTRAGRKSNAPPARPRTSRQR